MALFDLQPKETPRALFGRERELEELQRLLVAGRWVAILGPRMVGKTSLIKAVGHRLKKPTIYVNLWGARGTAGLLNAILQGLNASQGWTSKLKDRLRLIEGLTVGPTGVSINLPKRPLKTSWDVLELLASRAEGCVVALDEVQELSDISGQLNKILANLFNTHPDIAFVFSGSEFGLTKSLLEPKAASPMAGRPPARIELRRFSTETAVAFLQAGLKEAKIATSESELRDKVVSQLGGTPGWLTLFGSHVATQGMSVDRALALTIEEASKVVRAELTHFLEGRDRATYLGALKAIGKGATWTGVKEGIRAGRKGIVPNDGTTHAVLRSLKAAGFVDEDQSRYSIGDPILVRVIESRGWASA
jgi:uncharacterized protein